MIHIDRVTADIEVLQSPETTSAVDPNAGALSAIANGMSTDRLRHMVIEILREHLRDLERRGLL